MCDSMISDDISSRNPLENKKRVLICFLPDMEAWWNALLVTCDGPSGCFSNRKVDYDMPL